MLLRAIDQSMHINVAVCLHFYPVMPARNTVLTWLRKLELRALLAYME